MITLELCLACLASSLPQVRPVPKDAEPVAVYVLAGQSNMEGQAVVDLDHEQHYNGGRGTLARVLQDPGTQARFGHLRDDAGAWTSRDDVLVWYRPGRGELKAGPLSIGYAVYPGRHHFGPELQIGHQLGDQSEAPVLLIKTAWGGKSLARDFRPPGAGGEVGPYYQRMLAEVREALAEAPQRLGLGARPLELRGLFWFQGWNDMVDAAATAEYGSNLAHLIRDLRRDLGVPELPIVVAETGNCDQAELRAAQAAIEQVPDLVGTVRFVPTAAFRRPAQDSPNVGHGHHWFGNAESYLLIGDAMGRAMVLMQVQMQDQQREQDRAANPGAPRPLTPGWRITRFRSEPDLVTPVGLGVTAEGRVLVVESQTHFRPEDYEGPASDRILALRDQDGDGKAEKSTVFFEGTTHTMNLAVEADGGVLVATRSAVFRLRDADGDDRSDLLEPLAHLETEGNYPHNGLSGFALDARGDLYFGFGENLGADYALVGSDGTRLAGGGEGGNIYSCRPDGSRLRRVATGFWNPFHLCFDRDDRLFCVDNDPDSRPPCRLIQVVEGGDYGYRYRNGRGGLHPFTAWDGEVPGTLPMMAGTGEAPSGVISFADPARPGEAFASLLVTSWGDHRIERYLPVRRGASFGATMELLVQGGPEFRPVGIARGPAGPLYLSDWVDRSYSLHGRGRVWRLVQHPPAGADAARAGTSAGAPTGNAVGEIDRRRVRLRAMLAAGDPLDPAWLSDPSPDLRELAARHSPRDTAALHQLALADPSPAVRAAALRRLDDWPAAHDAALLGLLADPDPFLRQAARGVLLRSPATLQRCRARPLADARARAELLLARRQRGLTPGPEEARRIFADDPAEMPRRVLAQWIGEERLSELRPALEAALEQAALSPRLIESLIAGWTLLEGGSLNDADRAGADPLLLRALQRPSVSAEVRRWALTSLSPGHPHVTAERLADWLNDGDAAVRLAAIRSLAATELPGRDEQLLELARDSDRDLRERAEAMSALRATQPALRARILPLLSKPAAALRREAWRSLRGAPLSSAERPVLSDLALGLARGDERELAMAVLRGGPEPALPAPEDLEAWRRLLDGPADLEAGERLFFQPTGPHCARCHRVDGRGSSIGPELSRIGSLRSPDRLLESIVRPSLEVAPRYSLWNLFLADGRQLLGAHVGDRPGDRVVFADQDGVLHEFAHADIESRRETRSSLMPGGLLDPLTPAEVRDLLAYLQSRRRD